MPRNGRRSWLRSPSLKGLGRVLGYRYFVTGPNRCPSCSADVPAGARFCPSCGALLEGRSDERRIVTVLFADVVGYTALSESRDPERVKYLLDRCFERLARDVASHGGRVDKIVGDELMAVFGAPVAHEDDAERAVRAALQMQRTLADHSSDTGSELDMRIGINTGEVVVGNLRAGGDVTALGDVVNTASRLETSGFPGHVLVGESTYETTKEVIRYEHVGSLQLKGRDEPVEAWRAVEAIGPPGSRPGRLKTPLVGRKAELGMLWHALGTAVEYRRPHLVLIVGEAGMGKTMLVDEAVEIARAQHGALVLQGRCLPYGEANQWWPVAEALRQACGIDAEDSADAAATKCREAIASLIGAEDEGVEAGRVADALLYLMGYEGSLHDVDPSRARDEVVRSIQMSLAANARERPLVVVLSEIHWADQVVLDLIDTMFERLRNLPIVFMATARPDLEERWSPKPGRHNLIVVNLDALGRKDSGDLARTLLSEESGDDVVELIVERSGGNPLFIHELVRLLGETGGVRGSSSRLEATELPATLRGLVAARIDSLGAIERSALEDAAVVGRSGPVEALEALARARDESDPTALLESLTRKDLLSLADGEYEFRSDLVRDVAYETLSKVERARRHAAVADWLGTHAKRTEREEEYLERIAHHYAIAAELVGEVGSVDGVPAEARSRALEWLERATARAETRETTATATAVHLLEHALNLAGREDGGRRASFLISRARGLCAQREMAQARADVDEAMHIAEAAGDAALRARTLTVRGEIEQREGNLHESATTLEEAVGEWRKAGDARGEAEALRLWGFTSIHRGELSAAERAISDALNISQKLGDRRGEAWALQNLAWAAFSDGDYDLAEERLHASARLFEEIGDFGGRSWAIGLLGYVWYFKGRLDQAAAVAESSIEFSREMGDRWAHGMMLNLLAGVRLWQGRTGEALEHAREAHRLFTDIDDKLGLAQSSGNLAWALIFMGQTEGAVQVLESTIAAAGEAFGARWGATLGLATMRALVGDADRALELLDELGAGSTSSLGDVSSLAARALALMIAGRAAESYEAGAKAWSLPEDPGARANAGCVFSLVAAASGRPEEAIAAGDEVGAIGGTYVDQVRAHIGRALGYARLGLAVEAGAATASARTLADGSEDVVHAALARLAEGVVGDALGTGNATQVVDEARSRLTGVGVAAEPWERAFRAAVGA